MQKSIPFHKPLLGDDEACYALEAIRSGAVAGDGPFAKKLEALLEDYLGARHVLLVNSCTSALEMGMMALGIGAGDEVICPSFAFVSAANSILRCGAKPVFCEVEDATLNIDLRHAEGLISERTRAIIPVHYAGIPCDIEGLTDLAARHDLFVVEDAAQALGSRYRGQPVGTAGAVSCFSLHETKNLTCGEGGIFATSDDETAKRAEIIREKGTNRSSFLRGEVDKYTWVSQGSSYVLSDILAAIALAQFEKLEEIVTRRARVARQYCRELADVSNRATLPVVPEDCSPNWHIFYVRVDRMHRDPILQRLRGKGIGASFHFVPLHSSPFSREALGYSDLCLPVTERVAAEIIRLPIYPQLTESDLEYIVTSFKEILCSMNLV